MKMPVISKRTKWILIVVVIVIVGVALKQRKPDPLLLPVIAIDKGLVESTVSNTRAGTIKACQRSELSMSLGGRVQKLYVKEGDRVTPGQVLIELWNEDHKANVAQAEASLSAAEHEQKRACLGADQNAREDQRAQALINKKLISTTQAEAARTLSTTTRQSCEAAGDQVKMSHANLDLARAHFDLTYLRAPYAGVIAEVNSDLGEYVTPSPAGILTKPAIEILDDSCLYVTAPIDEIDAMPVRVGQRVQITMDAFRGKHFDGHVTRIAPYVMEVEKQARTVDVDVRFDNFPKDVPLLIGYSSDIEIILDERTDVLRVPTETIIDKKFVYVLGDDGIVHKREFTPGLANWTSTEVTAGLKEGEKVVLTPDHAGLKDGAPAKVDDRSAEEKAVEKKSP
jgi:HlyD family secretion protein